MEKRRHIITKVANNHNYKEINHLTSDVKKSHKQFLISRMEKAKPQKNIFCIERNNNSIYNASIINTMNNKIKNIGLFSSITSKPKTKREKKPHLSDYFKQGKIIVKTRSSKTYQTQFFVQKNVDFKVLSHRTKKKNFLKKEDTGIMKRSDTSSNYKIQDGSELFFLGKIKKKINSPPPTEVSKYEKIVCQTSRGPTPKFHSIFNHKYNLKKKSNKLDDFNIEKLVEIGETYANKWKPISSFNQRINTSNIKKASLTEFNNEIDEKDDKKEIKQRINYKKVIHVQISRKRIDINKNNNSSNKLNCNVDKSEYGKSFQNKINKGLCFSKDNLLENKKVKRDDKNKIVFASNKNFKTSNLISNKISENRYYGYDDRHNLEGSTLINHSYFESLYSKKAK